MNEPRDAGAGVDRDDVEAAQRALIAERLTALGRLRGGLEFTRSRLALPLSAEALETSSEETRERVAALLQRFGLLVDLLGATMKAAVVYAGGPVQTFADVVDAMEKAGVLESAGRWRALRLLRNRLAHEYELQAARLASDIDAIDASLPFAYGVLAALRGWCTDRLGIDAADAPTVARTDDGDRHAPR